MHRRWIERVSILSWRWGLTPLTAMAFSSQYMTKRGITPSYTHICGISASCWNENLFTDPIPHVVSSHGLYFHPATLVFASRSSRILVARISCVLSFFISSLNCWDTRGSPCTTIGYVDYLLADAPMEWAVTDNHYRGRAAASWPKLAGGRFKSTAWLARPANGD